MSPLSAVGSYPTRFTLTLYKQSGFVSVALSLGLPPVAVSDCLALCCPDFPLNVHTLSDYPTISYEYYFSINTYNVNDYALVVHERRESHLPLRLPLYLTPCGHE